MKDDTIYTVKGAFGVSLSGTKEELEPWLKKQKELERTMTKEEWEAQLAEKAKAIISRLDPEEMRKLGVKLHTDEK